MRVRVLTFGILKDWLGEAEIAVELTDGATVEDLLEHLSAGHPAPLQRGIAVSVNAEFSRADMVLHDGDEIGLLPPVSGGSSHPARLPSDNGPG